ncbi:MAG: high-affinity zinc transporter membrane component [Euryarchaeota archaeon ADurb.Bin009]|jgi:zinc transport system permease protein|uniref:metal ABC transporter permease n=1 Tax=Methanoculleus sp. TaxID=90427 RepID=UPI0009C88170|nr:metal ABC transporter permease [Methanoculleus sp.]OQC71722.1 MAG: high-affinity zinc transporter membrane component [Euryarchaeota archaeon ADurb.Bin009]HNQ32479.1 metal ABC transporter permease [Methanoculleus sp.]HOZ42431.1 metal ABC transporter permease [Methanoculleus sp.]HPK80629.1 metal ABC transporter permease [Methanoculleus sp.]HQL58628.1 metal ABC transporter permease [Methanoculleus sp.]
MLDVLGFEFFRNALIAGVLASIACGIIGTYVVVRRMVSVSGGISHAAFGGIGLGYFLGIDPLLGAAGFTVAAALGVGTLQLRARQQMDTLIGAVWAAGMAIGILFVYLTPGFAPDLFSYLFGNILLVPRGDILLMGILTAVIVAVVAVLYRELQAVTFDPDYAAVMNLPVERLSLLLLVLIALTVVMLIRVVGIILVIALLTLPAAISRLYTARVWTMMLLAVVLGIIFTVAGIALSYVIDVPSGATIVLVSTLAYAGALGAERLREGRGSESAAAASVRR